MPEGDDENEGTRVVASKRKEETTYYIAPTRDTDVGGMPRPMGTLIFTIIDREGEEGCSAQVDPYRPSDGYEITPFQLQSIREILNTYEEIDNARRG